MTKSFSIITMSLMLLALSASAIAQPDQTVTASTQETKKKGSNAFGNFVESATSATLMGNYDAKRSYKPAKATTKADSNASRKEKLYGNFQRTWQEVCGAYEHLPVEYFPYQPYYKFKAQGMYFFGGEEQEAFQKWYDQICQGVMKASYPYFGTASYPIVNYLPLPEDVKINGRKGSIPADEFIHHMACAIFAASPTDKDAFAYFTKVLAMKEEIHMRSDIEHPMEDAENGIVSSADNVTAVYGTEQLNRMQRERDFFCVNLCAKYTPWEVIENQLNVLVKQYETNVGNNGTNEQVKTFQAALEATAILECIVAMHPDAKAAANNEGFNALCEKIRKMNLSNIAESFAATNMDPVDMPTGVAVASAIQSKANQLLKKQLGNNFVKAIFMDKNWQIVKSTMPPYPITHRSLPVIAITKEDGKLFMQEFSFTQGYKSGKYTKTYNIQAGLSSEKKPVKSFK